MVATNDPEAVSIPHEQEPLLQHDDSSDRSTTPSADESLPPPLSKWRYIWWAVSMVLGTSIVALFIKGWIDSDDSDVSLVTTCHARKMDADSKPLIVRSFGCTETGIRWRSEWCCGNGSPGPVTDGKSFKLWCRIELIGQANSHNHEFPVPPWNVSKSCN
jgi:hypothetical protein